MTALTAHDLETKARLNHGEVTSITETDERVTVQLVRGDVTGNISIAKEGSWLGYLAQQCRIWGDDPDDAAARSAVTISKKRKEAAPAGPREHR